MSVATGTGEILQDRDSPGRAGYGNLRLGEGAGDQRDGVGVRGVGAVEGTALSLPGRKRAGKGAAAAAAAAVEYSVLSEAERGATVAPRGGGGAGARRARAEPRD